MAYCRSLGKLYENQCQSFQWSNYKLPKPDKSPDSRAVRRETLVESMTPSVHTFILIIGAGIRRLILAQIFRKEVIPFHIVERQGNADAGGAEWGFIINWSLPALLEMLPLRLLEKLPDIYVDKEAVARGEDATVPFFDLQNGEMKYQVPPGRRVRVNRNKLRKLLLPGIDVEVSRWRRNTLLLAMVMDTKSQEDGLEIPQVEDEIHNDVY